VHVLIDTIPIGGCVVNVQDAGTVTMHRCNRTAVRYLANRLPVCTDHADFRSADLAIELRANSTIARLERLTRRA
jgi:hypothetical protein